MFPRTIQKHFVSQLQGVGVQSNTLDQQELRTLKEKGYLALPNILSKREVHQYVREIVGMPEASFSARRTTNIILLSEKNKLFSGVWKNPRVLSGVVNCLQGEFILGRDEYRGPAQGSGWQAMHVDWTESALERPCPMCVVILALVDFTRETGPTRVVPSSHLLGKKPEGEKPGVHFPDQVELLGAAGTAFVLDGHLWHSGTLNQTSEVRHSILLTFWRRTLSDGRTMVDRAMQMPVWTESQYAWLFR